MATLFIVLFGYIPIIFALIGGALYHLETIISICKTIRAKRKIKKELEKNIL